MVAHKIDGLITSILRVTKMNGLTYAIRSAQQKQIVETFSVLSSGELV